MARRLAFNRTIEVLLLQSDKHLGEKYEIVRVKPIFARNVLLPQGIALLADKTTKNNYAQKMASAQLSRQKKATDLEDLFAKITADDGIELVRKANKDLTLYAKVDGNDLADQIKSVYGIEIEPHFFKLKKKLTTAGVYTVIFAYNDLKRELTVKIKWELTWKDAKETQESETNNQETQNEVVKTKEELKAEREAKKATEKAEKIAKLKEKFK